MRFAKPIDTILIDDLLKAHNKIITLEEGSSGGFAASVNQYLLTKNIGNITVKNITFPDYFIENATQEEMYSEVGMDTNSMVKIFQSEIIIY